MLALPVVKDGVNSKAVQPQWVARIRHGKTAASVTVAQGFEAANGCQRGHHATC